MVMGFDEEDNHTSSVLLNSPPPPSPSSSHPNMKHPNKTGTSWTALAHIITAVIGSGVLSLSWSVSQLGWIAGPSTLLAFASVTLLSVLLLTSCYKSPHDDLNNAFHTNSCYLDAVRRILGRKSALVCGVVVQINFIKVGIVYTITSSISLRYIFSKPARVKG